MPYQIGEIKYFNVWCPYGVHDFDSTIVKKWWSYAGSNRGPLECHSSALPAEL